jgi:hypothetical protein
LAHVEKFVKITTFNDYDVINPLVVVDAVRWWTPTADKTVDFKDVKNYILDLRNRGFKIKLVTFDRWNSLDIMNELKASGMNSETLSVAKKHYEDMQMLVAEERIVGPAIRLLIEELLQLRIIRDKVDHPRKGSKDLADAVCGAIYNAISLTPRRQGSRDIDVHTYSKYTLDNKQKEWDNIIKKDLERKRQAPDDILRYLNGIGMV